MKKFLITAVAVATLAGAAGAASAQPYGGDRGPDRGYGEGYRDGERGPDRDYRDGRDGDRGDRGGYGRGAGYGSNAINAKQAAIAVRIARGERVGALSRREGIMLRAELDQIAYMEHRFRVTYGLDRREVAILDARLDRLERTVFAEMRDGRGPGRGYGGGYGGGRY
ncbi:MAG: hypothetical protein Q8L23_05885 [Caulobacter sp.]|nr:hypothetical protein [Caulobacter sp.]